MQQAAADKLQANTRLQSFDFSRSSSQLMTVEVIRMAFLVIVLALTVIYQVVNSKFLSYDVFFSMYILMSVSFALNLFYSLNLNKWTKYWQVTAFLFLWESLYITFLIYFIGLNQSLLVFLYLINIILCGVVFQRSGGLYLALITSVCFSLLLSLDTRIQGNSLYLAVGVNNLAFFTVAYLSGYLSEQLNFMGLELRERGRDIRLLKNLNAMILDNMASGLLTLDNDDKVLQLNENAKKILKIDGLQLGTPLREKFASLAPLLSSSLDSNFESQIETGEGDRILRIHKSSLNDEKGEKQGAVVVFEDVTETKKLESRVHQSEKMAAIGQLAAGIAHEIRNPLASISGSVEMLQSESSLSADEKKLMSIVIKEIDRLNKLITEFLDYARPQDVVLSELNVSQLLADMASELQYLPASKEIQYQIDLEPDIKIMGHKDKLKQAFLNILINAIQSLEKSENKKVSLRLKKQDQFIIVEIADSGVGIDTKIIKKIFEPFLTTKAKGTGLGLAVVHSILMAHKATIDVESQKGSGTTFTLSFPSVM